MKTILVDMDNTLVDLLRPWLAAYRDVGGEHILPEDVTSYNFEGLVKNPKLFVQVLKSGGIFAEAKPMPGAQHGLRELLREHKVVIVTKVNSFNARAYDAKIGTMWRYFPEVDRRNMIFASDKSLIHGDVLIDDAPENLEAWLAAHPEGHAFMPVWPYNESFRHPRVTPILSLSDVVWYLATEGSK